MKTIIKQGSCKLGGLVFHHKGINYISFLDWWEQGCPPNCYIKSDPDMLTICHIPILDAVNDRGVLIKQVPKHLTKTDWRVPYYCVPRRPNVKEKRVYDYITASDPVKKQDMPSRRKLLDDKDPD